MSQHWPNLDTLKERQNERVRLATNPINKFCQKVARVEIRHFLLLRSVTRFCNFGDLFEVNLLFVKNFNALGQVFIHLGNFQLLCRFYATWEIVYATGKVFNVVPKWPNIEQIFLPSGHTAAYAFTWTFDLCSEMT